MDPSCVQSRLVTPMVRETPESAKPPNAGPEPASAISSRPGKNLMDANIKKTTLRMIPYGLYVLTAASKDGRISAGTVNFVTQASFEPPLVVVGVKTDSAGHALIKETKAFALNVLGKGQQALAFTFFKPAEKKGDTISGEPFRPGKTGAPILASTPAFKIGRASCRER